MQGYILPSLLRSVLIYLSSFNLKITDISPERKKNRVLAQACGFLRSTSSRFGPETPTGARVGPGRSPFYSTVSPPRPRHKHPHTHPHPPRGKKRSTRLPSPTPSGCRGRKGGSARMKQAPVKYKKILIRGGKNRERKR